MIAEATPTRRVERRTELYSRIIGAAVACYAASGFEGTTVPQVMERAGVGAGSLYRLFPGKEALFNAAFREAKGAMARAVQGALALAVLSPSTDDAEGAKATFDALWAALVSFAAREPVTFRFLELHHHAPHLDAESAHLERAVLEPMAALVAELQARGVLRDEVPPAAVIAFVWGALVGLVKAETLGYLELTGPLAEATRDACFRAFARTPATERTDTKNAPAHAGTKRRRR